MINFRKTAVVISMALASSAAMAGPTLWNFTTLTPVSGGSTGVGSGAVGCGFNSLKDICGTAMTFAQGTLSVTATGSYKGLSMNGQTPVRVVQDHWYTDTKGTRRTSDDVERYVGLGVYHKINYTSDDNVTNHEMLTLTFNQEVTLTGLNFRQEGHDAFSNSTNKTFSFNGDSKKLGGSISGLSVTGTTFTFGYGGDCPDQFYLSGMTVTAVPEPETYAMLLAGLGLMGAVARRRKAQQA